MTWVEPATADDLAWLYELDLDPSSSWLAMGTRALGEQPWLLTDDARSEELLIRARLIDERRREVLVVPDSAAEAAAELAGMIEAEGVVLPGAGGERSLDDHLGDGVAPVDLLARVGTSVQEDLCLLRRGEIEWELEAGILCFPSRWSLPDRVGKPLREVHGPTDGFDPVLADRITSLLDRLGDRVVRRRNWFVHPDPALFQPGRPVGGDPFVPPDRVLDDLFVRSERQTLRALPASGRIVFAIKIQQCRLGRLMADQVLGERFVDYLRNAPVDQVSHRGMTAEQVVAVLDAAS